jgi:hypothetical protein
MNSQCCMLAGERCFKFGGSTFGICAMAHYSYQPATK